MVSRHNIQAIIGAETAAVDEEAAAAAAAQDIGWGVSWANGIKQLAYQGVLPIFETSLTFVTLWKVILGGI